jgi:SAM-dependent methyltransferase
VESAEYETMFRVEETHWWYRALHELIFEMLGRHLPDWREKRILDAGCGTGAVLQRLGNPLRNVGIDLAPEAIAFCQRRGLANVRQADVQALPFADASFDAVISSSVLYHGWVVDVRGALREMHRVLRPGGLVLVNLPALHFLHSAHDEAVMTARRFTRTEVRSLLRETDFETERLTYWTTLLFPLAVAARTLHASRTGREFDLNPFANRLLGLTMSIERTLLKYASFPIGVALFTMGRKRADAN